AVEPRTGARHSRGAARAESSRGGAEPRQPRDHAPRDGRLRGRAPALRARDPHPRAGAGARAQLAWPLTNLGRLYRQTGDLKGARAALERGLAIRERALGPTHPDVAHSLDNLGYVLLSMGDTAGARARFERALSIRQQAFGPAHPSVAT